VNTSHGMPAAKSMSLWPVRPCAEDPGLVQVDGNVVWVDFHRCIDILGHCGFKVSTLRDGTILVGQRDRALVIADQCGSITFSLFECEQAIAAIRQALESHTGGLPR